MVLSSFFFTESHERMNPFMDGNDQQLIKDEANFLFTKAKRGG
jgi:hypothetical protein